MEVSKYQPNAVISAREDLNDELMVIRIRPEVPEPMLFTPGQYAELGYVDEQVLTSGTIERRQYSIASAAPAADGRTTELEFYVVLVPNGFFTPKLWSMKVGERLWVNPKLKGKFTLDPVPPEQDVFLVSTGTGLAPYVSMVRTYLQQPKWRRLILVHGVRFERDLGYRGELEALAKQYDHIRYVPATTREDGSSSWKGLNGRLPGLFQSGAIEEAAGVQISPTTSQIFLCGNPAMIDEMEVWLQSRGLKEHKKKDPGQVHLERYW